MRDLLLRSLLQKPPPHNIFNCCFLSQVAFGGVKGNGGVGEADRRHKITQVWRQPGRVHELTVGQMEEGTCVTKVWLLTDRRVNAILLRVLVWDLVLLCC